REDITNGIVRNQLAPCTGYNSRNDFFLYRLRQVRLDVIEMFGIEAIAHCNRQPKRESFFGLNIQWLGFASSGLRILRFAGGEQLIARIKQRDIFSKRSYEMRAGIKRSRQSAFCLAYPHS